MKFTLEKIPLQRHPANITWSKLSQNCNEPKAIELFTRKNGKPRNNKSVIYRLSGAGINGAPVIAKQAALEKLAKERFIYERILAEVPVPSLHFYGFVPDGDNETAWIFLGEGRGRGYSEENAGDRILVAKWLGLFHSITSKLDIGWRLKEHGADEYYKDLKSGQTALSSSLAKPYIKSADKAILNRIIFNFDIIESMWDAISRLCESMPRCVVHGDFISKNVTISGGGARVEDKCI